MKDDEEDSKHKDINYEEEEFDKIGKLDTSPLQLDKDDDEGSDDYYAEQKQKEMESLK